MIYLLLRTIVEIQDLDTILLMQKINMTINGIILMIVQSRLCINRRILYAKLRICCFIEENNNNKIQRINKNNNCIKIFYKIVNKIKKIMKN